MNSDRVVSYVVMEQQNAENAAGPSVPGGPADPQSGAGSTAMTYANLETLTRLNTEDLTSIFSSSANHHHHHHHHHRPEDEEDEDVGGNHYTDTSADTNGAETTSYIVTTASEAYHQGAYVVAAAPAVSNDDGANNDGGLEGPSSVAGTAATADNEVSGLSVHSYCKPSNSQDEGRSSGPADGVVATRSVAGSGGGSATELLDLKTVLPGPTTRRVLVIDDGHGDLEMAKSDVEFLLRGDAAGIVLREGKRSEVWARFGKVTFQNRKVKGYVACIYCRQVFD